MMHGLVQSTPDCHAMRLMGIVAIGWLGLSALAGEAHAQASSLAPVPQAIQAVPERIDPIIAPLPVPVAPSAAVGKPVIRNAAGAAKLPACNPGERLQRKTGTCQAVAASAAKSIAAKPAAARPTAAKTAPAKPATAKTALTKAAPAKGAKASAKRG
jgi:hypothetical protein